MWETENHVLPKLPNESLMLIHDPKMLDISTSANSDIIVADDSSLH